MSEASFEGQGGEPSCACLSVRYTPEQVSETVMRERWECELCGREFLPNSPFHLAEAVRKRLYAATLPVQGGGMSVAGAKLLY